MALVWSHFRSELRARLCKRFASLRQCRVRASIIRAKSADPVHFFAVRFAEPLKAIQSIRGRLSFAFDLLLNVVQQIIEFRINFKE